MRVKDLARNIRKGETLFPLFLFIVVGVTFYDSLHAPPRPMLLPRAVQFILLVLLTVQTVKSLMAPTSTQAGREERRAAGKERLKMLITFLGMMLIPLSVYLIGFLLTGCLYVALTILFWGGRRLRDIIIAEAILIGLIYGVFHRLLAISFPAGLLFGG